MEGGGSRGISIAIFIIVALLLIGYVFYMFEAYRGGFFPFTPFNPNKFNMSDTDILALGAVTDESVVDDANKDELNAKVTDILANNVEWYTGSGTAAIKLQGKVLGTS